jgi:hypothetical protein
MNSQSGTPRTEIAACFHNRSRDMLSGFVLVIAPFSIPTFLDREAKKRGISGP